LEPGKQSQVECKVNDGIKKNSAQIAGGGSTGRAKGKVQKRREGEKKWGGPPTGGVKTKRRKPYPTWDER